MSERPGQGWTRRRFSVLARAADPPFDSLLLAWPKSSSGRAGGARRACAAAVRGERSTTPQAWPRWRAAELAACAIAAVVALLPALLEEHQQAGATLRNLAGLGGLTALGAVAVGARLAWLAPTASAFTGAAIGSSSDGWLAAVTWPIQAGDAGGALALAAALALAGASLHMRLGARPSSPAIQ